MSKRKPHNDIVGYVAERVCRHAVGGHIVIYDREKGFEIDADCRWIVMHEPSSIHVAVPSRKHAYDLMNGLASGDDCGLDILGGATEQLEEETDRRNAK